MTDRAPPLLPIFKAAWSHLFIIAHYEKGFFHNDHQDPACIRCPCGARMSELLFHQTGFTVVTQLHLTAKHINLVIFLFQVSARGGCIIFSKGIC